MDLVKVQVLQVSHRSAEWRSQVRGRLGLHLDHLPRTLHDVIGCLKPVLRTRSFELIPCTIYMSGSTPYNFSHLPTHGTGPRLNIRLILFDQSTRLYFRTSKGTTKLSSTGHRTPGLLGPARELLHPLQLPLHHLTAVACGLPPPWGPFKVLHQVKKKPRGSPRPCNSKACLCCMLAFTHTDLDIGARAQ